MKFKNIGLVTLIVVTLAAFLAVADHYNLIPINPTALIFSRWLAIAGLFLLGLKRKSLTTWILIHGYRGRSVKLPRDGCYCKMGTRISSACGLSCS